MKPGKKSQAVEMRQRIHLKESAVKKTK